MFIHEVFHGVIKDGVEVVFGFPAEQVASLVHVGDSAVAVFVADAVELLTGDINDLRSGIAGLAEFFVEDLDHALGELLDGHFVLGRADVEDLAVAGAVGIFNDANDAIHGVINVGVGAEVGAAVHQLDGSAVKQGVHEMAEHAGVAGLFAREIINAWPDEVEGADDGVVEALFDAVGVENALEELIGTGIDPAVVLDRAHDEGSFVLDEGLGKFGGALSVGLGGGDAVNFAGRELDDALFVLHAIVGDLEVLNEVEFEDIHRIADIEARVGPGHEVNDQVVLDGELLELFLAFANVEINVVDLAAFDGVVEFLAVNVESGDLVFAVFDQAFGEVCADEPTGTK